MDYIIDVSDGNTKNHPHYKDLVSSSFVYNSQPKSSTDIEDLPDDSDYRFYQNVEYYLDEWLQNPNENDFLVDCIVPETYIWSSTSKDEDGYDRVESIDYDGCKRWLRRVENGNPKGFVSEDAGSISISIRFYKDDNNVLHITFVKNKGNHRFTMKKMVNPLMNEIKMISKVKFHPMNTSKPLNEHEANRHFTEAEDNKGMGEKNKVMCGYVARIPNYVQMMDWLGEHKVDYNGILAQSDETAKDYVNVESVSGICDGIGNGLFKKYGKDCMDESLKVTRDIANNITKEKTFKMSALRGHALWYRTWTRPHDKSDAVMTTEQLTKWFHAAYNKKNFTMPDDEFSEGDKSTFKLKRIAMSGEVKDLPYILCDLYFDESISLKAYYKKVTGKQIAVGFGHKSKAVHYLLDQTDRLLKGEVANKITSWN